MPFSGSQELRPDRRLAVECGVGLAAIYVWCLVLVFFWVDGGITLYEYYPVPQILGVLTLLGVLIASVSLRSASTPQRWARLFMSCFLVPGALTLVYGDVVGSERREFLLKAHSVGTGDSMSDVRAKLGGYDVWEPSEYDWVSFSISPSRNCRVAINVYLAADRETVTGVSFKHD